MTSSAHESARPWGADSWPSDEHEAVIGLGEHDVLAHASPAPAWSPGYDEAEVVWESSHDEFADQPTAWAEPEEFAAEGLTGRALIVIATVVAGGCALLDLALTSGRMTFFFDLCFVVICLMAAMAVRRRDLFTAGVLPPLLFAGVIAVLAVAAPSAFDSSPGVSAVFLSGLASHAAGLIGGYAAALLAVGARMAGTDSR